MININSARPPTACATRNQIFLSNSVEQFRSFYCAGTDLWWDLAAIELDSGLKDSCDGVNYEDDFSKQASPLIMLTSRLTLQRSTGSNCG